MLRIAWICGTLALTAGLNVQAKTISVGSRAEIQSRGPHVHMRVHKRSHAIEYRRADGSWHHTHILRHRNDRLYIGADDSYYTWDNSPVVDTRYQEG